GRRDDARPTAPRRRRGHDRAVPAALAEARADRPLGASGRVPLAARAGRGARLRLRLRRPARALVLPRRRAAPRRRDRARRRLLLSPSRVAGAQPAAAPLPPAPWRKQPTTWSSTSPHACISE